MQDEYTIASVTTTVGNAADAERLADLILGARLAACVQLLQIASHYRWQEALHRETEWQLECKTALGRVDALLQALRQHHPYELPQLLVQQAQAEPRYADWVEQETRPLP